MTIGLILCNVMSYFLYNVIVPVIFGRSCSCFAICRNNDLHASRTPYKQSRTTGNLSSECTIQVISGVVISDGDGVLNFYLQAKEFAGPLAVLVRYQDITCYQHLSLLNVIVIKRHLHDPVNCWPIENRNQATSLGQPAA